ncbi:DUF4395 domain-containing protein [Parasediminibacterium sp. JCM 36343]|uniref:DUF4395 domain-containing protein n=1 Tax=Parasediminibacterium sp. JCM 36343 TaxID=3374279 RepID=UPI00397E5191
MSDLPNKSAIFYGNKSKIRLTAFFVMLLAIAFLLLKTICIPAFLVIDFALRSFDLGKYSPLASLSGQIVTKLKLPQKPVYLPPKRFAARIGLVFVIAIFVLCLLGIDTLVITAVLVLFEALESLFGFCAGCYVYSFLQRLKLI